MEPHGRADGLRNRSYLGEVYFRDRYHAGPHPALIDHRLFDRVQSSLKERGEDHARRASNGSDYLLAGLVRCAHCGKRFVGNAATGNRYRYRYYTCFSRQRYGTTACPAERLPAEELDNAILDALLDVYAHHNLFEQAVQAAQDRAGDPRQDSILRHTGCVRPTPPPTSPAGSARRAGS